MKNYSPANLTEHQGVITVGNPIGRPWGSYRRLRNFRVIPGFGASPNFLRLRDGRKLRYQNTGSGKWLQFHGFNDPVYSGWDNHIGQYVGSDNVIRWRWFSLNNWALIDILTVDQSNNGGFGRTERLAVQNYNDAILLYNGLGTRTVSGSRSPFTMYFPSINQSMYWGMDACVPGGVSPSVSLTGVGSVTVLKHRKIWVGLFNELTGHYSNAVYCGQVGTGTNTTIQVSNLQNLTHLTASAFETSKLRYVFYSSLDGLEVPYLLLDPAEKINPLRAPIDSASFSITEILLDSTKEAPSKNHPPRPMRWLAKVNGRFYGALLQAGQDTLLQRDFTYTFQEPKLLIGIVYSAHELDAKRGEPLGVQQQCWPPGNYSQVPNSKIAVWGEESPGGDMLHVLTGVNSYFVEEAVDRIHEWTEIPGQHGIKNPHSYKRTPRGAIWVNQRNEIVLLRPGTLDAQVLSKLYQDLLPVYKIVQCAVYVNDPVSSIDRYEVHCTDGSVIVHDFASDTGYEFSGTKMCAGESLTRQDGNVFHLLSDLNGNLYTQAGQPESSLECQKDDVLVAAVSTPTILNGTAETNWTASGRKLQESSIGEIVFAGDKLDTQLLLESWADFETNPVKSAVKGRMQSPNAGIPVWRFEHPNHRARFVRFRYHLLGVDLDEYYPSTGQMGIGGLDTSMAGALLDSSVLFGS